MASLAQTLGTGRRGDFWSKVDKSAGPNSCWPWTGKRLKNPKCSSDIRGRVKINGLWTYAHRRAWILSFGEIAHGLCVCHRCDNPICCNPAHLFLGTHIENCHDRDAKGRNKPNPGENNGRAKITTEQAKEIVRRYKAGGISAESLGRRFGISRTQTRRIIHGKSWAHIKET